MDSTAPTPAGPRPDGDAPPMRRDAARNRQLLLTAAAEVFAEYGAAASLRDVADRAGLGIGTVYRHMPDKDAVIEALLRPQLQRLLRFAEDASAAPPSFEAFADLLTRVSQAMAGSKALSEILLYQHELPEALFDLTNQIITLAGDVMTRAQQAGHVRADLATTDLVITLTGLHGVEAALGQHGAGHSRRLLTLVLDGMRAHPVQPTVMPVPPLVLPEVPASLL